MHVLKLEVAVKHARYRDSSDSCEGERSTEYGVQTGDMETKKRLCGQSMESCDPISGIDLRNTVGIKDFSFGRRLARWMIGTSLTMLGTLLSVLFCEK